MKRIILVLTVLVALIFATTNIFAQFDIKGKVERKTNEKIDQKIDETLDEGINGVFQKKEKTENEESEEVTEDEESEMVGSDEEVVEESSEEVVEEEKPVVKPDDKPKLESYSEYDFIPGDQILFFEDFSQDAVGDFPALWTSNGGGEVKTLNLASGKWLHMNGDDAVYCYMNKINFPENFIVEFDIIPDAEYTHGYQLTIYNDRVDDAREMNDDLYPGSEGVNINFKYDGWSTLGYRDDQDWLEASSEKNMVIKEQVNHVIIWVQKRRVRIYHAGQKVLDAPTNLYTGTKFNRIRFSGWDRAAYPYISNLKITTASPDMRSKLLTEGKLVSYGIYFDSGKDVVKPESYGSVKEIAAVLTENPAVKIMIVGHTDSDGDDAMNLDLSKRRAASVKNYLVKEFGISADRITTDGKGESVPLMPNSSTENKAKNRRVEFIKL
jgi:outer membrane protein OmpA-like peptidoglycan-associated protein